VQSVAITTNVASDEVYSIKFVSDLQQVSGFLQQNWPPRYNWNIVESDVQRDILVGSAFFSLKKTQDGRSVAILITIFFMLVSLCNTCMLLQVEPVI
jgi:hypothetical protein